MIIRLRDQEYNIKSLPCYKGSGIQKFKSTLVQE